MAMSLCSNSSFSLPHHCRVFRHGSTHRRSVADCRHHRKSALLCIRGDEKGDREVPAGSSGDEPPESLFMKELRKRGMSQKLRDSTDTRSEGIESEDSIDSNRSRARVKAPFNENDERKKLDQRERSMALNSEGLEGLIPRARVLISLGGSFILVFWPFMLAIVAVFLAVYIYFGDSFIHPGTVVQNAAPIIDPYELLEKESLPSQLGPSRVPYNYPN